MTEEDEAFDEIARKQGMWGGGFQAKRQMAADKLQEPWNEDEWRRNNWRCQHGWLRGEQCEICNASLAPKPAYPAGPCDCGVAQDVDYWIREATAARQAELALRRELEALAQPAQESVAHLWECLGKWSAYLVTNGKQADCAPPSWLVEAIQNATAPPKREWIGLTEEDFSVINQSCFTKLQAATSAESILKERNT